MRSQSKCEHYVSSKTGSNGKVKGKSQFDLAFHLLKCVVQLIALKPTLVCFSSTSDAELPLKPEPVFEGNA
jgi:hypothetical protein